jgi:hypothetical protein
VRHVPEVEPADPLAQAERVKHRDGADAPQHVHLADLAIAAPKTGTRRRFTSCIVLP